MNTLNTGTKPSRYATTTRATLGAIAVERDELRVELIIYKEELECKRRDNRLFCKHAKEIRDDLEKQNKTLAEELEDLRQNFDVESCARQAYLDRNKVLEDFIKGIARHDLSLSDMCPHKVYLAAREILGWPIEEDEKE